MTGLTRRTIPRQATALLLAVVVASAVTLWLRDRGPAAAPADHSPAADELAGLLAEFAAGMRPTAPYRPPTPDERAGAVAALGPVLRGGSPDATRVGLAPLGFSTRTGLDRSTGRRYVLALNEPRGPRAWGAYLIDLSAPVRLVVEVPHPHSDLHTERLGLALWRAVPGTALLVAGAHRRSARGAADVAHRTDSLFHAVAAELAGAGVPQVQLHGFHDDSLPGRDIVLSAGAGAAGSTARRAGDALAGAGFEVCRAWQQRCGRLSGTRNAQGRVAAGLGAVFLHIEIGRSVRDDEAAHTGMARALATALTSAR